MIGIECGHDGLGERYQVGSCNSMFKFFSLRTRIRGATEIVMLFAKLFCKHILYFRFSLRENLKSKILSKIG